MRIAKRINSIDEHQVKKKMISLPYPTHNNYSHIATPATGNMSRLRRRFGSREEPWWQSGVNFTCLPDCGRCCDEPGGIVYLSREDAERIANHFDISTKQWLTENCRTSFDGRFVLESKPEDGRCIYLTGEKTCSIYEVKPAQCSAFPFWRENVVSERAWEKTKSLCPGIDHDDAIEINGNSIKLNLEADRIAEKGFRFI